MVERRALAGQLRGERRWPLEAHLVPADVRDPTLLGIERADLSADQPESGCQAAELSRRIEKQLHAQADAEQRRAGGDPLGQQRIEAIPPQVRHPGGERSHSGEHERVGLLEVIELARDGGVRADMLERLLHRAPVTHVVVDDGDPRTTAAHTSVPLVLGTPTSVGSSATAARRALANALKTASIMW